MTEPVYHTDSAFYIGDFDSEMEGSIFIPFYRAIKREAAKEEGCIDMFINSHGGYTHLAFHLVEMMEQAKSYGITVRTIVTDTAMSSGSIVSVAGTPGARYVSKNAVYLIHYGYVYGRTTSTPVQVERNADYQKKHFKKIRKHYERYCDIPDLEQHMTDDDWFFGAKEAKRWNVADSYLDRMNLLV